MTYRLLVWTALGIPLAQVSGALGSADIDEPQDGAAPEETPPERFSDRPGGPPPFMRGQQRFRRQRPIETIDEGFVFINGKFLPSPYKIKVVGDGVTVNGQQTPVKSEAQPGYWRGRRGRWNRLSRDIAECLKSNGCVVAFRDQTIMLLSGTSQRLLMYAFFTKDHSRDETWAQLVDELPGDVDKLAWWSMAEDASHPDLERRMQASLTELHEIKRRNRAQIQAVQRLYQFSYPLTVAGMVVTVLCFGHLLSTRPPGPDESGSVLDSRTAQRMVARSLGFIALFALLDLVWTILTFQAGQMEELNPLGSQMIESPIQLIAFKVATTCLAVGILGWLWKYRTAQTASWWLSLVYTLVTARWLLVNTMFV